MKYGSLLWNGIRKTGLPIFAAASFCFWRPSTALSAETQTPPASAADLSWVQTILGDVPSDKIGFVLPHEHIFTDLRGPLTPGYGEADAEDVVRVMKPLLEEAKLLGVDTLVETTSIGVGRNVSILARLSRETGVRIVVSTGVYGRAQFAPPIYREMSEADLAAWMIREIREGIDGTRLRAGIIKVASSENELTVLEEKFLRSAGRAAAETGVAVASHTTSGAVAAREAAILAEISPAIRFIWVHAQAEQDRSFYRRLAARGVYIEFDSVGAQPRDDSKLIEAIKELVDAGYGERILLSHDAGWYQPGKQNGGSQRPFTYLIKAFIPKLRLAGLTEKQVAQFTVDNPRNALAIPRDRSNQNAPD